MKSGRLIRAFHDLETHWKRNRGLTGNQERMSSISSARMLDTDGV
jgi:hypothetical protein